MLTDMSTEDTADTRNYSETVGTRLTPQTKRQFDQYREENELGKTEAARRLIRDGLDDTDETLVTLQKTTIVAAGAYLTVYLASDPQTAGLVGAAYIAILTLWTTYPQTVGQYLK